MLEIGGHRVRVVCPDRKILSTLGAALADHIVDGEAFLGFKVDVPLEGKGLFVLLGADGSVLARSRHSSGVLASLTGHLAGLAALPPVDRMRFRLRTVVGPEHAVLVDPSLLRSQPIVERRLVARNCSVVDLPFADIDINTMRLCPVAIPWSGVNPPNLGEGHQWSTELSHRPVSLILPASASASVASDAEIHHVIASRALSGDRSAVLDAAAEIAQAVEIIFVDPNMPGSLQRAIESMFLG